MSTINASRTQGKTIALMDAIVYCLEDDGTVLYLSEDKEKALREVGKLGVRGRIKIEAKECVQARVFLGLTLRKKSK